MDNARESEDEHCLYAQELVFAYNRSMVLRAAIQLGLLDALAAGDDDALTADELAVKIHATDGVAVDRILRFLASFDVVRCSTETSPGGGAALIRRYTPAPVCRWLTKNNGEGSLAPFSVFIIDEDHLLPWYIHSSYNPIYDCELNQMVHHMRTKWVYNLTG